MDQQSWLTERFEENRPRLRGVAYRMLGSLIEAEDAVQEAWLRLNRIEAATVETPSGKNREFTAREPFFCVAFRHPSSSIRATQQGRKDRKQLILARLVLGLG